MPRFAPRSVRRCAAASPFISTSLIESHLRCCRDCSFIHFTRKLFINAHAHKRGCECLFNKSIESFPPSLPPPTSFFFAISSACQKIALNFTNINENYGRFRLSSYQIVYNCIEWICLISYQITEITITDLRRRRMSSWLCIACRWFVFLSTCNG